MSDHGMLPPVCSKHNEPKHIEFGRGYECRSCVREEEIAMARAKLNPLPPSEKAELQVSLLNEIGLTLTAVARALDDAKTLANQRFSLTLAMSENVGDIRDVLHIHKLSLEGIQGLLVELEHSFDVIAEVQANSYDAVVTKFMHIEKRLAQIEERLEANEKEAVGRYERLLMLISVLHDAGPKPRKAGKRKRVKR